VWEGRAKNTKTGQRPLLDFIKLRFGAGMLRDLKPNHIRAIRQEIKTKTPWDESLGDKPKISHGTASAKIALGVLSTVWKFVDTELNVQDLPANPTAGVARGHTSTQEYEPWPPEVLEAFEKAAPARLKVAFYLAIYTGQRVSDLVQMMRAQYDGRFIHGIKQQKTKALLSIPCH
jgi:integrase